jgi:hypothetical protein
VTCCRTCQGNGQVFEMFSGGLFFLVFGKAYIWGRHAMNLLCFVEKDYSSRLQLLIS